MENENPEFVSLVYSEEVLELVRMANGCAVFLESFGADEPRKFIEEAPVHLAGLYSAMLAIGECEAINDEPLEQTVSEQDWSALYQRIATLLREKNDILRPAEEDEFDDSELVKHTVSEDLADIYQELRDFTTIYSRGMEEYMNDALWELKERFAEHWGKKVLRALAALHELMVSGIDPAEE